MNVGNLCHREVYLVKPGEPLADAAREMQRRHIGALVVVADLATPMRALGIVTDRDIVCGQFLRQADLRTLTVGDVMTRDPLTLPESASLSAAIAALRSRSVRRAPVVNEAQDVVGIVTIDDLLPAVAAELDALAKLIATQSRHEGGR